MPPQPELIEVRDCVVCRAYFVANAFTLIVSAAELASERITTTTDEVVKSYMVAYHQDGHQ